MPVPIFKRLRALLARSIFMFHGFISIWRVAHTYSNSILWCFLVFVFAIFVEGALNIYFRFGNETRWFCPSIFLFLCSTVPPIWLLELYLTSLQNSAERLPFITRIMKEAENETTVALNFGDANVQLPYIRLEMWAQILEQTLLVVLILGRWLLPKGELTREQLSNILLGYLATAADAVDFLEVLKEPGVRGSLRIGCIVLCVWTLSLIQYAMVITSSRRIFVHLAHTGQGTVVSLSPAVTPRKSPKQGTFWVRMIQSFEVWSVLTSVCLQDFPFLIVRLYLLNSDRILSYTMIFFTCKNTLICLLQTYRLVTIFVAERKKLSKKFEHSPNINGEHPLICVVEVPEEAEIPESMEPTDSLLESLIIKNPMADADSENELFFMDADSMLASPDPSEISNLSNQTGP